MPENMFCPTRCRRVQHAKVICRCTKQASHDGASVKLTCAGTYTNINPVRRKIKMKNSFRFFENRDCKYFPCHQGLEDFNCLFCYCPFYLQDSCPGTPAVITHEDGTVIRDCSDCVWPHRPENYSEIIKLLSKACRKRKDN